MVPRLASPRIPRVSTQVLFRFKEKQMRQYGGLLQVSSEVKDAIQANKPVIALESTIYTHGFPHPDNVQLALDLEKMARQHGAVPATIGIIRSIPRVGLTETEITELASAAGQPETLKISRRDLPYATSQLGGKVNSIGGTTVAGTMILAHLAGIRIFATGGLGGVHRGGENSMDISADLTELGRTPVAVISSGCKSFLDIPRTLEYLETQGVTVATFADGREAPVDFPGFWSRDSGSRSPLTISSEKDAASMINAHQQLGLKNGLLFGNPLPQHFNIHHADIANAIDAAIRDAEQAGAKGKDNTPFILARIREITGGSSVAANRALIESNVKRAAKVAVLLSELEDERTRSRSSSPSSAFHVAMNNSSRLQDQQIQSDQTLPIGTFKRPMVREQVTARESEDHRSQVYVAGSLAWDVNCDYTPFESSRMLRAPQHQTSNPARISQDLGGVGHNVALAAQRLGVKVRLFSAVGNDLPGSAALAALEEEGMSSSGIQKVREKGDDARTAQYVAVNDAKKDLHLAMADMTILEGFDAEKTKAIWGSSMGSQENVPGAWLVVDANWKPETLDAWVGLGAQAKLKVAFEPVSAAKSTRLFPPKPKAHHSYPRSVFPENSLHLMTPNSLELTAMHAAAHKNGYFEGQDWWTVVDNYGIRASGVRTELVSLLGAQFVDQGLPQMSLQLLPFCPTIVCKLGSQGVLLTELLRKDDERLWNREDAPYVLARNDSDTANTAVGGVYMRQFSPAERVDTKAVVSVNGVGDTFLGALIAGLCRQESTPRVSELIDFAQRAAVLTLRSTHSVSPELSKLLSRSPSTFGR